MDKDHDNVLNDSIQIVEDIMTGRHDDIIIASKNRRDSIENVHQLFVHLKAAIRSNFIPLLRKSEAIALDVIPMMKIRRSRRTRTKTRRMRKMSITKWVLQLKLSRTLSSSPTFSRRGR